MSNINNSEILEDLESDFDFFLKQEKWNDCEAIIQNVGDMGFESSAIHLHHLLNMAKIEASKKPGSVERGMDQVLEEVRAIDSIQKGASDEEFLDAYYQDVDPRDEADRRGY